MKIIIFDTETTGLPQASLPLEAQPYICQFAGLTVEVDMQARRISEVGRIDQLVKPLVPIPEEARRVHGISDADVADAPPFAAFADELINAFHQADVAVAHNISFDQGIIENELVRLGRTKRFLPEQTFDTMTGSKDLCQLPGRHGKFKSPTLTELHQFLFEKPFDGAHNAMEDVIATARCMKELLSRGIFRPVEPTSSQASLF